MKHLTTTICLTIAVLLGSAGMNYASSSPVRYSDLSEITYVNHNGKTINLTIDSSDPKNTKLSEGFFGADTRLVGHFAVEGGSPYSPLHGSVSTNIGDPSNLPNLHGFLHKPVGSKVKYDVTEEWGDYYMPWKLEATISRKSLLEVSQQKMLATQVVITGESTGPSNSQWHIVGIKFRETRIIDPQTNVTLTFKREWESRTKNSPDELETLELVSVKLKSGRTITLNQLASESEKKYIAKQKILAAPGFSAAAEEADLGRYWAGTKAVLSGETDGDFRNCELTIKYSNDGLMYSAFVDVDSQKAYPGGKCSGKVDKFGNLERRECTPGAWGQRDIVGTVWAPKYDNVSGSSSGGCQWTDQKLLVTKKVRSSVAKAIAEEKRRSVAVAKADAEEKRRSVAVAKAAADKKRRASQAKAAADKKRRASQAKAAADKKRRASQAKAAADKKRLAKARRLLAVAKAKSKRLETERKEKEEEQKRIADLKSHPNIKPRLDGDAGDFVFLFNETGRSVHGIRDLAGNIRFEGGKVDFCGMFGVKVPSELYDYVALELSRAGIKGDQLPKKPKRCGDLSKTRIDLLVFKRGDLLKRIAAKKLPLLDVAKSRLFVPYARFDAQKHKSDLVVQSRKAETILANVRKGSKQGYGLLTVTQAKTMSVCAESGRGLKATKTIIKRLRDNDPVTLKSLGTKFLIASLNHTFINLKKGKCRYFVGTATALKQLDKGLTRDGIKVSMHHDWVSPDQVAVSKPSAKKSSAKTKAAKTKAAKTKAASDGGNFKIQVIEWVKRDEVGDGFTNFSAGKNEVIRVYRWSIQNVSAKAQEIGGDVLNIKLIDPKGKEYPVSTDANAAYEAELGVKTELPSSLQSNQKVEAISIFVVSTALQKTKGWRFVPLKGTSSSR